jgi:hypothetical protein
MEFVYGALVTELFTEFLFIEDCFTEFLFIKLFSRNCDRTFSFTLFLIRSCVRSSVCFFFYGVSVYKNLFSMSSFFYEASFYGIFLF